MSRGNILVVDGEKFFRTLYEEVLMPEGYVVSSVESGKEALALLKKQSFDVILADMAMPGWDGIRTMEEIKKLRPAQEIIIVTHISDLETAVEAMKNGERDLDKLASRYPWARDEIRSLLDTGLALPERA